MEGTLDDVIPQVTLTQRGLLVRAVVLRGIDLAVHVPEGDRDVPDLDPKSRAGLNVRNAGHKHPLANRHQTRSSILRAMRSARCSRTDVTISRARTSVKKPSTII